MTNMIAKTIIVLTLTTNWTGHIAGTNELGYVATNYTARVKFQGQTHSFELKIVPGNVAAWRVPPPVTNYLHLKTNSTLPWRQYFWTNNVLLTNAILP